ncbi:MAG: tetratricopeptide repeat protein [Polyangiaceae bacterium]
MSQANAQAPGPKSKPQPLNLVTEPREVTEAEAAARRLMESGDCKRALDAFDAAIALSRQPTLYRDRGFCHEKLGHPYPAIDDFRAYLTLGPPDAADRGDIRDRLDRLEDKVNGRPSKPNDDTDVPSARATESPRAARKAAPTPAGDGVLEYVEPDPDAIRTPLRHAAGWSLAPFFSLRNWLGSGSPSGGGSSVWAECLGIQIRDAVSGGGAVVFEAGYEAFNLTSTDALTLGGLSLQVAYEIRVPLDPEYDNQILVVPGLGYEHLSVSPTNALFQPESIGAFVPRLRIGVRHLIKHSTAVDLSLGGGVANFFQYGSFPYDSNNPLAVLVTADLSVAWGL